MTLPELSHFRLVGGTSLALQLGHRTSIDIDLFTDTSFENIQLQLLLRDQFKSFQLMWENRNGFTSKIDNAKVDFFNWHIKFIKPAIIEDSLRLMDKIEIAAMKLETIATRKEKKDFIDIYFLLQQYSLKELITNFKLKYPFISYKFIVESLMAVDYADNTEAPEIFLPFDWNKAKKYIVNCTNDYVEELGKKVIDEQQERLRKAEELLKNKKDESKSNDR